MNNTSIRWALDVSKWCPTFSDMLLASSCIQLEEKERCARFVFKKDLKSSLIGLLMMRKFVYEVSGKPYNAIRFERDNKGKPHLVDNSMKLNFNISHHGNYVVCVGEIGPIMLGVDLMKVEHPRGTSLSEFFKIMANQFSPQEWMIIKELSNEKEQLAMFYRHWCLKESYVKAIGIGITENLQDYSFKVNTKTLQEGEIIDSTELYVKGEKLNWKFHELLLDQEHYISFAIDDQSADKISFIFITFEELMHGCIPLLEEDESFVRQYFTKLEI